MPKHKRFFSTALDAISKNGWVTFAVATVVVLSGVVGTVFVILDHIPKAKTDPNIAVCKSIDADRLKAEATSPNSGPSWLEAQRVAVALRVSHAVEGSNLEQALVTESDSLDAVEAWYSSNARVDSSVLDVTATVLSANVGVADACGTLGVKFRGYQPLKTADGSISQEDAVTYCDSALALLHEAATDKSDDQHLWDVERVMLDRADKGLPPNIYNATVQLATLTIYAVGGEGYPPGEQGAQTIAIYCQGLGATGWPISGATGTH